MNQAALLCGCGGAVGCPRCQRRARLSRERYCGERESVLRRDDYQCQACGELAAGQIVVHHRARRKLITLCRRCHPKVHFTARPGFAFAFETPFLYLLWRELHRRQPEQRLLLGAPAPVGEQKALFADR